MSSIYSWFNDLLGLGVPITQLHFSQMAARSIVVFPCALLM